MTAILQRLLRVGGWGLLDQSLISVANFLTLLLLARNVTPGDFGLFTLVYGVMLVANYVQVAFVTQPHNVIGATLSGPAYRIHTRSLLVVQLLLSFALAIAGCTIALAARELNLGSSLVLAAAAALPLWQVQEYTRRVLYTEGRQAAAFANDVVTYGGQMACVTAFAVAGALTAPLALFALAAAATVGTVFGLAQIRRSVRAGNFSRRVVLESLSFGKWLVASIAAQWTSTQSYLFIAATVLGVAVTGALKAAQLVLSPLHVLMFSLSTMLPIRLSRTLAHAAPARAERAFRRDARIALRITLPLVAAYCGFVAVFADEILSLLYGSLYDGYGRVLMIMAGYYVFLYLAQFASALLTARRHLHRLFLGNVIAAALTILCAWPLMRAFGAEGAAVLLLVSAAVLWGSLWRPSWRGITPVSTSLGRWDQTPFSSSSQTLPEAAESTERLRDGGSARR